MGERGPGGTPRGGGRGGRRGLKRFGTRALALSLFPVRPYPKGRHPWEDSNKCNPAPLDSGIIFNIYAINVHFVRLNDRQ